jgi:polysaccharide biosynthesis transport protein
MYDRLSQIDPLDRGGEKTLDVHGILAAFRRRLKLFVIVAAAVFAVTALITLQQTPKYTAMARIVIDQRKQATVIKDQEVVSNLPAESSAVDTEVEILRSRSIAERVAGDINLFQAKSEAKKTPSLFRSLLGYILPSVNKAPDPQIERETLVDEILDGLDVARAGDTYMIDVSYSARDPARAALLANSFAKEYIIDQIDSRYNLTQQASEWLSGRLAALRKQADEADAAVQSYKAANNLVAAQGSTIAEQEVSGLNQQLALARAELAEKEARLSTARGQLKRGSTGEDLGAALDSPVIQQLRQQRAVISQKAADLEGRYGDRHPDLLKSRRELIDLDAQIHSEVTRIISNLEAQVEVARQHAGSIVGSLSQTRNQLSGNARASVRLNELQRNLDSTSAVYQSFLDRYKQASAQVGMQQSDARVVSAAKIPTSPSSPRVGLNFALGFIIALLLGVGAVVIAEMFDTGLSAPDDIELELGVPALAVIPSLESVLPTANDEAEILSPEKYVVKYPLSQFAESFRSLRAAIRMCRAGKKTKLVAITSSVMDEGKTTTAIALIRIAALAGDRALLVDCDLRHRGVNIMLPEEREAGLVELLSGTATLADVIVHDVESGADILPLGRSPFTPRDLLASDAMQEVLGQLSKSYDLVILDTPPVLAVSDTRGFVDKVDAVVVLARWSKTPRKVIQQTLRVLHSSGAYIAGVALSRADYKQLSAYGSDGSDYYYNDYSSKPSA